MEDFPKGNNNEPREPETIGNCIMELRLFLFTVGEEAGLGMNTGNIVKVPRRTMFCC